MTEVIHRGLPTRPEFLLSYAISSQGTEDGTMHRRLAAAVALSATLLLSACTDDAPQPPRPSQGPKMPSDSPSSSSMATSTSPRPTKHADLLKVQALYKTEFAEETKVLKAGGANKLPPTIRQQTTDPYQHSVLESFRAQKKEGGRLVVGGKIVGVAMGKWTPTEVTFQACEDYTNVKSVDKHGNIEQNGPGVRTVQKYLVVKIQNSWRIKDAHNKDVKDFTHSPCNGTWYS